MVDVDVRAELREWFEGRPQVVRDLAIAWPPGAVVKATGGRRLMIPAPGMVGQVTSYYEDGTLGVTSQTTERRVSPATGEVVPKDTVLQAACQPDWLEIVELGKVTPNDVRAALGLEEVQDDGDAR